MTPEFITAGKAIFTVEIPESFQVKHNVPKQYTYSVNASDDGNVLFIGLLTGPDNYSDYTYMGILNGESIRLTKKSKYNDDSFPVRILSRVLGRVFKGEIDKIRETGFDVHHEGQCGRCGRRLTDSESIKTGLGPTCRQKV